MFNLVSDFCFVLFLLFFLLFAFSLAVILKYVNLLSLLFSLTLSLFLSLILILSISCQQTPSIFKTCFSQSLSFTYSSFFFFFCLVHCFLLLWVIICHSHMFTLIGQYESVIDWHLKLNSSCWWSYCTLLPSISVCFPLWLCPVRIWIAQVTIDSVLCTFKWVFVDKLLQR